MFLTEKNLPMEHPAHHELFIPTIDSVRNNYFLTFCVKNVSHLLVCGAMGTGKTAGISHQLASQFSNAEYSSWSSHFSAHT